MQSGRVKSIIPTPHNPFTISQPVYSLNASQIIFLPHWNSADSSSIVLGIKLKPFTVPWETSHGLEAAHLSESSTTFPLTLHAPGAVQFLGYVPALSSSDPLPLLVLPEPCLQHSLQTFTWLPLSTLVSGQKCPPSLNWQPSLLLFILFTSLYCVFFTVLLTPWNHHFHRFTCLLPVIPTSAHATRSRVFIYLAYHHIPSPKK